MNIQKFILLVITISGFFNVGLAQKKIKSGSVIYKIDNITAPGVATDQLEMVKSLFSQTDYKLFFDQKNSVFNYDMMGIMSFNMFLKENETAPHMFMNMYGQKIELVGTKEEMEEAKTMSPIPAIDDKAKVISDKKDTRKIAGYNCYKVILKSDKSEYSYYVTPKIKAPNTQLNPNNKLPGFPLELSLNMNGMSIHMIAKEVNNNLPSDVFKTPEGYKKMTISELQKKMGGGMTPEDGDD